MNNSGNKTSCTRREFIKYTGMGVAAVGMAGSILLSKNVKAAPMSTFPQEEIETDVLVIGGGIAGTFAALRAHEKGVKVILVDKGMVGRSGKSPWYGITSVFDPSKTELSREEWTEATVKATEYIAYRDYNKYFLDGSKAMWDEMTSWGSFKPSKINHSGLYREQLLKRGIELRERIMITDLIKKDGEIVGAAGFPVDEDKLVIFKAKAVLNCGGAGTFKGHGYAVGPITFDAHMMAYRAGAEISGKEWTDFHTFPSVNPTTRWGHDFGQGLQTAHTPSTHPQPSAAIEAHQGNVPQARAQRPGGDNRPSGGGRPDSGGGRPDSRGSRPDSRGERPDSGGRPSSNEQYWSMGGTSGMAEHHLDGIFPKGDKFSSTIPGLFAAGDALCTACVGLLGSGSAVAATYAAAAGVIVAEYAKNRKQVKVSTSDIKEIRDRIFSSREREKGYSPKWVTQVLQSTMMPYYVLNVKKEERLKAALTNVEFLRDHFCSSLIAEDPHALRLAHETQNLVLNAEMKLRAGLFRTESRHNHYREEFPARDDENWLAWVIIQKDGDNMKLTKRMLPEEWHPDPSIPYEERYTFRLPGELEFLKSKKI